MISNSLNKNKTYYPQLDSFRALAVLLVIWSHWFSKENFFNKYTDNGRIGVTMFFVLSGFLITGILINNSTTDKLNDKFKSIKTFYIRRALRIFPAYYFLLFILFLLNFQNTRSTFWWHFFYCSNILFWIKRHFFDLLSPFWSLSVEEQFYLIWPVIILTINKKYFEILFIVSILFSAVFRFYIVSNESQMGRFLLPSCIDSFCIGGLLSYGRIMQMSWYKTLSNYKSYILLFSFMLFIFINSKIFNNISIKLHTALYFTILSFCAAIWIDFLANDFKSTILKKIFNNPVLLHIGKVSYGLYLLHSFIPFIYGIPFASYLASFSYYFSQSIRFLILLSIASLSFYLIESPILKLKNKFNY